jgi:dinuclear metal center YbgI/SA1388 family protein
MAPCGSRATGGTGSSPSDSLTHVTAPEPVDGAQASAAPRPTLAEVVSVLDRLYEPSWAEDWDSVGTVVGRLDQPIAKVMFAVDPVQPVIDEAVDWGADLLVVHHPLLLRPVHSVAADNPKGRAVHDLISNNLALHVCHTNADSPAAGVSEALALALGIEDSRPLVAADRSSLDKLVTFVPRESVEHVIDALSEAGAGAIGDYDRCAFTSPGLGTFRPGSKADPTIGTVGEVSRVDETRLEMVLPRSLRVPIIEALRAVHPYEEPAFDVFELASLPAKRGTGRIGRLTAAQSLRDFVDHIANVLPATAHGVRVAGDEDRVVRTVAVVGGAGDSVLAEVRAAGPDAYVTSDLRHHPASEFREHPDAPALIDVSHWAAEWAWLPVVERALTQELSRQDVTVETRVSRIPTDPWTFHVDHR